ncbi:MAG TPA: ATP-binding cassette domain-containing protein, partial [Acidimicrobiales bacterium]|nr:ATP-binding cassette domain-containing protein [Acidimicrobiales bacterium]
MHLEIDDVRIAYGRTEVVYGMSLDVPDGSFTCLMGRNGVGKTTLLNGIMGMLPLKAGRVRIGGRDITGL